MWWILTLGDSSNLYQPLSTTDYQSRNSIYTNISNEPFSLLICDRAVSIIAATTCVWNSPSLNITTSAVCLIILSPSVCFYLIYVLQLRSDS